MLLQELITSGLWDKVKLAIINYNDFRKDLETVVTRQKEQNDLEKSIGVVLGNVADKVTQLMDKIMEIDVSQEGVAKLLETFKTEVSKFDNTFGNTPSRKPRKISNKN
jgi:predicted  nucleic acid-binding Zn-ribbon protein